MHRPNTDEELRGMLGDSIADACRTAQHDAFDEVGVVSLGRTHLGHATVVNRACMETAVSTPAASASG
jgi:nickel-dependent lactate racemase